MFNIVRIARFCKPLFHSPAFFSRFSAILRENCAFFRMETELPARRRRGFARPEIGFAGTAEGATPGGSGHPGEISSAVRRSRPSLRYDCAPAHSSARESSGSPLRRRRETAGRETAPRRVSADRRRSAPPQSSVYGSSSNFSSESSITAVDSGDVKPTSTRIRSVPFHAAV